MKELDGAIVARIRASGIMEQFGLTGIYRHHAPRDAEAPYLIFAEQSKLMQYVLPKLAYLNLLYQVKAVQGGGSALIAQDADDAIAAYFTDNPFEVEGYTMSYIRPESGFELDEVEAGQSFDMIGHMYRIHLEPIPKAAVRLAATVTLANA